ACVALAGVQGWRWWTAKQAEEASAVYAGLAQAARANDLARAKHAAVALEDRFARTGYAPRGALVLAKLLLDSGDTPGARAQLQWVIDRADETELQEIERSRLGAPVREALGAVRGLVRRLARRCAGGRRTQRRCPYRVSIGAREIRRQVAVPQLCAGEARFAGRLRWLTRRT